MEMSCVLYHLEANYCMHISFSLMFYPQSLKLHYKATRAAATPTSTQIFIAIRVTGSLTFIMFVSVIAMVVVTLVHKSNKTKLADNVAQYDYVQDSAENSGKPQSDWTKDFN